MAKGGSGFERLVEELKKAGQAYGDFSGNSSTSDEPQPYDTSGGGSSRGPHDFTKSINVSFSGPSTNKGKIILGVVIALILAAAYWWWHPAISINSGSVWSFILIFIALPLFLVFWNKHKQYDKGTDKIEPSPKNSKKFKKYWF